MYHPILFEYAKQHYPNGDLERLKRVAKSVLNILRESFDEQEAIDSINWAMMVRAINRPDITEEDFMDVYDNGWDEDSLLYSVVASLLQQKDFSNKKLEDYL